MFGFRNAMRRLVLVVALLVLIGGVFVSEDTAAGDHTYHPETPAANAPYAMYTPLAGQKIAFSSPALGNLDADSYLEIVVGGIDGRVYAIKPNTYNGTILWSFDTSAALSALAHNASATTIRGAIAIADLDNDGHQEVIVPVGTVYEDDENGGLVVLTHDGNLKPGWPQLTFDTNLGPYTEGLARSPVIADLDGDGDMEILAGTFDMRIYAWHHDGTRVDGWPQFVYNTVWSSPIVGDLDNDGLPEVVVGTDAHLDPYYGSVNGGALYIFNHDGTLFGNFPKYFNEIFESFPALVDLNGDGYLDIVIGGGSYYGGSDGRKVHVLDRFGNYLPGWPQSTGASVTGSPAIADIDNNGDLEVAIGSRDTKLYAWHHNGAAVSGFPMTPRIYNGNVFPKYSVAAADMNGATHSDGKLELFFHSGWEITVVSSAGQQITYNGTTGIDPFNTAYTLSALPAIADVDNDGKLELVAGGGTSGGTNAAVYVWDLNDSTTAAGALDWPMLKHDAARSGIVPRTRTNDAAVAQHTIPDHWFPDTEIECEVVLRNTGSSTWTEGSAYRLGVRVGAGDFGLAQRFYLPAGMSVAPGAEVTFAFTLHTPPVEGFYPLQLRMVRDGYEWFGRAIDTSIKVGNQPALQILYATNALPGGGVQPGGLAEAIGPLSYNWTNASAFALTFDAAGYYLSNGPGGYVTWGGTAEDVGSVSSAPAAQVIISPDGEGYYVISDNGVVTRPSTAPRISLAPPTFSDHRVRSFAVAPDAAGFYVLDKYGNIYRNSLAPLLTPATPTFTQDIAIKLRLTLDAKGYYVLDRYGRVHNGGTAPAISPAYALHIGEDWARDFVLTEDGKGYYLLDKHGNIHTGGTAVPLTLNPPSVVGDASAIGLELADGRIMDAPYLAVGTDDIFWMTEAGGGLPSMDVSISNGGFGDELNWTAAVISGASWLGVSPPSGTTPSTIQLRATTSRSIGVYSGLVRLSTTIPPDGLPMEKDITVTWRVVDTLHQIYMPIAMKN